MRWEITLRDEQAFDDLYTTTRDRLSIQVSSVIGSVSEGADCVQEAFVRAWARWEKIQHYEDPEGWVRRVSYNIAVSRWRKAKRILSLSRLPQPDVEMDESQVFLMDALRCLSIEQRRVIVMHYLADLSVDEIASDLHVPPGTIKSRLSRARSQLSNHLQLQRERL